MSTAKSMASSYLNGKRQQRFKSSACNLSTAPTGQVRSSSSSSGARAKSTSMTNLSQQQQVGGGTTPAVERPASRNNLDSIHNGMNARYAQVQSKVYLQNIKPSSCSSKIPAGQGKQRSATLGPSKLATAKTSASGQAAALQARLAQLEEQLRQAEAEAQLRGRELELERQERQEQVASAKRELEERAAEFERQAEEQHRKLLEAYELADQNRRSADALLAESRQRDEEARRRRQELEQQLEELREFVQVKEELAGKMGELREQLREERERYEQQLANLKQVFENEKIRLELELMEKVRQVGESYELDKLKSANRTMELDARLAGERLAAAKLRLAELEAENLSLAGELRALRQEQRAQERQLVRAEAALGRLADERRLRTAVQWLAGGRRARAPPRVAAPAESGARPMMGQAGRTMAAIRQLRRRLQLRLLAAGARAKGFAATGGTDANVAAAVGADSHKSAQVKTRRTRLVLDERLRRQLLLEFLAAKKGSCIVLGAESQANRPPPPPAANERQTVEVQYELQPAPSWPPIQQQSAPESSGERLVSR